MSVMGDMEEENFQLRQQRDETRRTLDDTRIVHRRELAAREAVIVQMREALKNARHMIYYDDAPLGWNITRIDEALALPSGRTALDAMLKPLQDRIARLEDFIVRNADPFDATEEDRQLIVQLHAEREALKEST